jgi:hypothetical protein
VLLDLDALRHIAREHPGGRRQPFVLAELLVAALEDAGRLEERAERIDHV